MSDNYVQFAQSTTALTTITATLSGVTAGNAIVAFCFDGTNAPGTSTCTDSQGGTFNSKTTVGPDGNGVWCRAYVLENAASGSHTITWTADTGDSVFCLVVEVGSSTASSYSGANSNSQASPGTGTDAVTSNSVTVTGAATLVSVGVDTGVVNTSNCPTANASSTSRANDANAVIGSWRMQTRAVSSNTAGTFTAVTGTDAHQAIAASILNGGGGGGGSSWRNAFAVIANQSIG